MAAKTPQQYNGGIGSTGNGQPHAPSSSLGTTAVNRNSYHDLHPLSHNAHTPQSGPSFVEPAASSSDPRHHSQDYYYSADQPRSSLDGHHIQNHPYQQHSLHDNHGQTGSNTFANSNHLYAPTPARNAQGKFTEEWDASQRGSSIIDSPLPRHVQNQNNMSSIHRSNSFSGSTTGRGGDMDGASSIQVSRSNTLKKKSSLRRNGSLGRSGSRRSMKAGSVRSLALQSNADEDEMHSAFYCPVPTKGNPTEALANRFQAWRKILKDIITYFKEIQTFYEQRSKSFLKLANVLNNVHMPPGFLQSGGLDDAVQVLRNYNSQIILEANKAREIEEDVVLALTGLRTDLQLKIKEIKSLSGDFKNSVEKEMEVTRKVVRTLQDALGKSDLDSSLTTGKEDPYLLRLAVDRQLERQLDEENYLHQAYLNLENSGRELESIVVGEIQKSYNAYAGILKREADVAHAAVEDLRVGPIAMPKDHEWAHFVQNDDQFVDPNIPIRSPQHIHYPGRNHYACQEIRAGLLERKSKYLKSYTAGWYVLSPTHLHEFKSADKTQSPVMSLYLPEQRLGSHSQESGSSPKFILKGRQTSGVHRSHSWVFRAESFDTMMAWYEDIKALTEKTPQERSEFVRGHSRSFSRASSRVSMSSDGVVDEDDEEPYSAHTSEAALTKGSDYQHAGPRRPSPGGRFPSDIEINAQRGLQAPLSPSSTISGHFPSPGPNDQHHDNNVIAAAGALPGSSFEQDHVHATEGDAHHAYTTQPPRAVDNVNHTVQDQPTQQQPPSEAPYANHPARIIAARGLQNNKSVNGEEVDHPNMTNDPEGSWLGGGPIEAASIPAGDSQRSPQQPTAAYAAGLDITGMKEIPQTTVLRLNGIEKRPAYSERTESDAPTLSSEVQTISNLHVPGEYPKNCVQ
ncbi:phosphatidylinositol 4,5-bisphosphate-binding protein [Gnomoniopsis smithogilvyi]|uniref:Phosphatidylinositol 4,5-bisphosphate-binding protein n=1 Tax=Gnomoniopsis smithogilvyi TaxID=1191159 RepID=A0A9W9CUY8_9PEZI|nr:phosphatidylinositol 4,5-bisphosphate-binding protein [Gnomoniopsis smithogilvyi]